jgi:hypothetical protein
VVAGTPIHLAALIELDRPVVRVRYQFEEADDPGLGARALVSAGKLCLRFFANEDALVLARRGLQLAGALSDAEHVCRRLELYDVMLSAAPVYEWEAAAEEYAKLAEQALDHGELSHARLGYHMASYVRWIHGHWAGAQAETLQAEMVTRGASDEEHVIGMAETAKCLAMLERDLNQADAMLMEAGALAVRGRIRYHAIPAAQGMLRYHEGKLDEAQQLLGEARLLCKSAGDRISEFQANEYLAMVELERGDYEGVARRCRALKDIGGRLREGSEAPFAESLDGLCRYALNDEQTALDDALQGLRDVDAKHRLAYLLNRAAEVDLARGRPDRAADRAREALSHASVLDRRTEMLVACVCLARAHQAGGDEAEADRFRDASAELATEAVSRWAKDRAESVSGTGMKIAP